jgi:hypothetical protein
MQKLTYLQKQPSADTSGHAPLHTATFGSFRSIFYSLRRRIWWLHLGISVLLSEAGSLLPRTQYRLRKRLDLNGVDLGAGYQPLPNGGLEQNTCTHFRIRDMRHILSTTPWATPLDLHLFLAGWDCGETWRSAETCRFYIEQKQV